MSRSEDEERSDGQALLCGPHVLWIAEVNLPDPKSDQKDCKVDIARATVRFCPLGEGQMAPSSATLRRQRDKYQGVVSLESVYRPDNGTFEDGFRKSLPTFKRLFGS